MPPSPTPDTTREMLLTAATQLLDAGGVERVTLREVGRLAGVSHNAPYKHFSSKEDLLAEIARRELRWLSDVVQQSRLTAGSADRAVHEIFRAYIVRSLAFPERFALVFTEWQSEPVEFRSAAQAAWRHLVESVEAAQQDGALPAGDPERVTALIRALAHGAIDLARSGHLAAGEKGNADPEDLLDDLFSLLTGSMARST